MGASCAKGRLLSSLVPTEPCSLLEIGCSAGNLARAFARRPEVDYTGLDIDGGAIALARRKYRHAGNLEFHCATLGDYVRKAGRTFDLIAYAGVLHHNDDEENRTLLALGRSVAHTDTTLLILEPVQPLPEDGAISGWFLDTFERGTNVKTESGLTDFLHGLEDLDILGLSSNLISITPFPWPKLVRMVAAWGRWA